MFDTNLTSTRKIDVLHVPKRPFICIFLYCCCVEKVSVISTWRLSLNEKPKILCESSGGVWNYLVYDYTCSRIWFLFQLKVDLPEYGARLYVRDSLFSDTLESCILTIVYRTLYNVLRLQLMDQVLVRMTKDGNGREVQYYFCLNSYSSIWLPE